MLMHMEQQLEGDINVNYIHWRYDEMVIKGNIRWRDKVPRPYPLLAEWIH